MVAGGGGRPPSPLAQLVDGPGREPVAAGLVPGKGLALQHAHVVAGLGQPEPGGAPRRTAPDHEDVVPLTVLGTGMAAMATNPVARTRRHPPSSLSSTPASWDTSSPASSRSCSTICAICWSSSWPPNAGIVPPPPTGFSFAP